MANEEQLVESNTEDTNAWLDAPEVSDAYETEGEAVQRIPIPGLTGIGSFGRVDTTTGDIGVEVPNLNLDFAKFDEVDDGDDSTSTAESLKRTWNNSLDQLSLTDDRFIWLSEYLFGDTDSSNFQEAEQVIADTEAGQQETIGFTDLDDVYAEQGVIGAIGGGVAALTNAGASFLTSAAQAASTGGAALAVDMVQSGVRSFNQEKAGAEGVTLEELIKNGDAETFIPGTLGALAYKFERYGIKGVGKFINGMSSGARKTLVSLLNTAGKEGGTEFAQSIVESFSDGLGKSGNDIDAGVAEAARFIEEDGLETILQGAFGGGISAGGGRALRKAKGRIRSAAAESAIKENTEKILEIDKRLNDPNVSEEEKKTIQKTRKNLVKYVKEATLEPNKTVNKLTDGQINKINKKGDKIQELRKELQESRKLGEETYDIIYDDINDQISDQIDGINSIIEDPNNSTIRESDGTLTEQTEFNKKFEGLKKGEVSQELAFEAALKYEGLAKSVANSLFKTHPGFKEGVISRSDFINELQVGGIAGQSNSLLGLALSYDPEIGSFGGYAKKLLRERGKAILNKHIGKQVEKGADLDGEDFDQGYDQKIEEGIDNPITIPVETRKIAKRLDLKPETAAKTEEVVNDVLTSKKLDTATTAGFNKAVSKEARKGLYRTVADDIGVSKKEGQKFHSNLVKNWENYLKVIPKESLNNSQGITKAWAETKPTRRQFVNYFKGIDLDAGESSQKQIDKNKTKRREMLANWIAEGLFNEAANDLLVADTNVAKQFQIVQDFKDTDKVNSISAARVNFIKRSPISESRIKGKNGKGEIVKSEKNLVENLTDVIDQAWNKAGKVPVRSTTNKIEAALMLVRTGHEKTREAAEKYINEVHGFTVLDNNGKRFIYNDKNGPTDTPIHEMGHVWSAYIQDNNPKLWREGVKILLKDDVKRSYQAERLQDYGPEFQFVGAFLDKDNLTDDEIDALVDSEDPSVIRALDEILAGEIGDAGNRIVVESEFESNYDSDFKKVLKKIWNYINETLTGHAGSKLSTLTAQDFLDLAASDVLNGTPGAAFATMRIPVGTEAFEQMRSEALGKLSPEVKMEYYKSTALGVLRHNHSYQVIDGVYDRLMAQTGMSKREFLDWVIDVQNQNTLYKTRVQDGLMANDFEDVSTEKMWKEVAGEKVGVLLGRPAKAWQNDEAKIQEKFDKNRDFFKKHEDLYVKHLPKEFWLAITGTKKDGTQKKESILRVEDAEAFAAQASSTGIVWDNPDAFGRITNANSPAKILKIANDPNYKTEVFNNQAALFSLGDAAQALYESGEVSKADVGTLLKSFTNTGNGKTNFFRKAPSLGGYSENISKIGKDNIVPEHNPPAGFIALDMFNRVTNAAFDREAKEAIAEKFKYWALDKADDPGQGVGPATLKSGVTKGFDLKYDDPLVRYIVSGGNIMNLIDTEGNHVAEKMGVTRGFIPYVKDSKELKETINTTLAIENGASFLQASKKKKPNLAAFDFDDTLASTDNKVKVVHKDGTESILDSEQFSVYKGKPGDKLDFTDFDNVKVKEILPAFDKLKAAVNRGDDVVILTARTMKAGQDVKKILRSQLGDKAKNIKFKGVAHSSPDAKANYLTNAVEKYGYRNVYFIDDAKKNVDAVKKALGDKAKVEIAGVEIKNKETRDKAINSIFKVILNKGLGKVSKFTLPPNAEDFRGLLFSLLPGGKEGQKALEFFDKFLIKPYWAGVAEATKQQRAKVNAWNTLVKKLEDTDGIKVGNSIPGTNDAYTYGDAIRVASLIENGKPTGLNKKTQQLLLDQLKKNPYLNKISRILNNGYNIQLTAESLGTPINEDILKNITKDVRKNALEEFRANTDVIFSKENLDQLEKKYGKEYVQALENILKRMKAGRNRLSAEPVNPFLAWAQRAVSTTLAWNMRSGMLQLLSMFNYVGLPGNTFGKVLKAVVVDNKQYRRDFKVLKSSPYVQERQRTSKFDVLAEEVSGRDSWLDKVFSGKWGGFAVTKWGDRNAIALGGAAFYRNRINQLVKEGLSKGEAQKRAYLDFVEYSESAQQSADPANISQIQSTDTGKLFFAFANTPFQYARIAKRKVQDLVSGRSKARGTEKQDFGTAIYYTGIQTAMFTALQSGLAFAVFDDDEEVKEDKFWTSFERGLTSLLKSMGYRGAAAATALSIAAEIGKQQSGYSKKDPARVAQAFLAASPPVSIKFGDLTSGVKAFQKKDPEYVKGVSEFTAFTTGLPADRVFKKLDNVIDVLNDDMDALQRIARAAGWSEWDFVSFKIPDQKDAFGNVIEPGDSFFSGAGKGINFSGGDDDSPWKREETGQAFSDGTIEVDPNLSPIEREKTIAHEQEHVRQMNEDGLDYDDNYVYYKGGKHRRRNGKIRYNGKWMPEGDKKFPWEAHAYEAESPVARVDEKDKKKEDEKYIRNPKHIEQVNKSRDRFEQHYSDPVTEELYRQNTGFNDLPSKVDTALNTRIQTGFVPQGAKATYDPAIGDYKGAITVEDYTDPAVVDHELSHAAGFDEALGKEAQKILGKPKSGDKYLSKPSEVYGNLHEFRARLDLKGFERNLSPKKVQDLIKFNELEDDPDIKQMIDEFGLDKLSEALNKIASNKEKPTLEGLYG